MTYGQGTPAVTSIPSSVTPGLQPEAKKGISVVPGNLDYGSCSISPLGGGQFGRSLTLGKWLEVGARTCMPGPALATPDAADRGLGPSPHSLLPLSLSNKDSNSTGSPSSAVLKHSAHSACLHGELSAASARLFSATLWPRPSGVTAPNPSRVPSVLVAD